MKSILVSLLLSIFTLNICFADCDFKTGITPGPNKTFIYSEECHLKVGQLAQDNSVLTQQVGDLTKAIQLKDLAITASDSRATLWSNTSASLEDRLQKVDSMEKSNSTLYFGLGILLTLGAAYAAGQLIHR
jgi:hypothetical protein